jgi:glycosyltransferase involved in cell wall biosynthesis
VPGSDGTCRAVCDAMAFGVPVVCTRRGMLPSLVGSPRPNEQPGVVCDEDPRALANALVAMLRDDDRRRAASAAALRRARTDMDPAAAAERTAMLYRRLVARQSGTT